MSLHTLTINGKDAKTTWGMMALDKFVDALLMPPPAKEVVKNTSRLEHGTRIKLPAGKTLFASREFSIDLRIRAADAADYYSKHTSLMAELASGWLLISTSQLPGVVFRCRYVSCQQYSQYNGRVAKFALRLEEPDPSNREP